MTVNILQKNEHRSSCLGRAEMPFIDASILRAESKRQATSFAEKLALDRQAIRCEWEHRWEKFRNGHTICLYQGHAPFLSKCFSICSKVEDPSPIFQEHFKVSSQEHLNHVFVHPVPCHHPPGYCVRPQLPACSGLLGHRFLQQFQLRYR